MPDSRPPHPLAQRSPVTVALMLIVIVVSSLVGLDIWQSWTSRHQALLTAQTNASNMARSLAEHAGHTFEEADTVLIGMVERAQVDGTEGELQRLRLHRLMKRLTGSLEQLHGLFIYDRDGRWVVSSNEANPPNANNADRDYFIYHRTHNDLNAHLGPVIRSRSTGDLIITLSRRINDSDGRFAGVALATIKVEYFKRFYESYSLDPDGVINLVLADGTVLVRRPYDEQLIGTSIAKGVVFSQLLPNATAGTRMLPSVVDGVERLYGYRAVSQYPLVVLAAESKTFLLANWRQNMLRTAMVILLLLSATGIFGAMLIRQIRQTAQTEAELRNAHAALELMAMQDSLTGLANRRQLDQALPMEIGRARRNGRPLGVIMLDIDHFKAYNDIYGHPAGDACIRDVGQAVVASVGRAGDLVVRYGGEELLVLLPECDLAGAVRVAERMVEAVRGLSIPHTGSPYGTVTVSAGAYMWFDRELPPRPQALVEAADAALYRAKAQGRNQVYPACTQPV
ncbi:sensor domain-containing diguanylate cyclase [Pseudomonas japonica]|uniref:sensor domain-containing diguanylate cyclase n=1 Tax=Pseudomonas japonica TaxID=256466 RepID=UPI0015E473A1|nr:diguanylate cyclase [Pseudomonas japonica]MBA1242214.1 diguanylate cyclase [Pseudomonas japonica]